MADEHAFEDLIGESVHIGNGDEETQSSSSAKKRKSSEVWNHFSVDKTNEGKSIVKCMYCDQSYAYEGSRYGTSTLNRHLEKCKKKPKSDAMLIEQEGRMKLVGKNLQKAFRELMSKATIKHDLPMKWCEYDIVRSMWKLLYPDIQLITRNTLCSDVLKLYDSEKEKLKLTLKKIPGRVCLTADTWTAITNIGYICVTAHFVDEKWKLNSKLLAFCDMPPPHSGTELAQKVYDCMVDYGIDRKVFSITLDNASANNSMVKMLKARLLLLNSLVCNGDYFHIRCSAHILNLVVQQGLRVASAALEKIRASIKYIKFESRMIKFRECARKVGTEITSGLELDVPTRWNSTFLMLASAIKYRSVFAMLALEDLAFKHSMTDDEWERAEKMCVLLRPFYTITMSISGSSYPTSNLYFIEVWKIQTFLQKNLQSSDILVREMSVEMKQKFDKYWEEYSEILSMGAVFDPRIKLKMLEYCYSKLDVTSSREKVENLKRKMHLLYEEYREGGVASSSGASSQVDASNILAVDRREQETGIDLGIFDLSDYDDYMQSGVGCDRKSPLDKYFEEEQCDQKKKMDVLEFWKHRESVFGPELCRMACDVLSIPITTVASESSFSIGSHILTKYRNRLLPKTVQALICTRNWLHGFSTDGESDDEDGSQGTKNESGAGSNIVDESTSIV